MGKRSLAIFLLAVLMVTGVSCKSKPESSAGAAMQETEKTDVTPADKEKAEQEALKRKAENDKKAKELAKSLKYREYKGKVWGEKKGVAEEEYSYDEVDESFYGNATFDPKSQTLTVSGKGVINGLYNIKNWGWSKEPDVIKKLIIEEGVTEIWNSFDRFPVLETIEFPKSLEKIYNSFERIGGMEKLTIPATVKEISDSFYGSSFRSIDFEGSVYLHTGAFNGLPFLELAVISEGSVCEGAFRYCDNLEEVVVEKNVMIKDLTYMPDEFGPEVVERNFEISPGNYPKAYLYMPTGGDDAPWGEGGKYWPIFVNQGESWEDYRDTPMKLRPKD